jgi:hypothetical protein
VALPAARRPGLGSLRSAAPPGRQSGPARANRPGLSGTAAARPETGIPAAAPMRPAGGQPGRSGRGPSGPAAAVADRYSSSQRLCGPARPGPVPSHLANTSRSTGCLPAGPGRQAGPLPAASAALSLAVAAWQGSLSPAAPGGQTASEPYLGPGRRWPAGRWGFALRLIFFFRLRDIPGKQSILCYAATGTSNSFYFSFLQFTYRQRVKFLFLIVKSRNHTIVILSLSVVNGDHRNSEATYDDLYYRPGPPPGVLPGLLLTATVTLAGLRA